LMARRDPAGVRLLTHDWSGRFPLIAAGATQGTMAVNR
jgi:hypothetical protein